MMQELIEQAADLLRASRYTLAFTGAGISVESGIAPFRGPGGLWEKQDPKYFEKRYFMQHPGEVWPLLKELFYDTLPLAQPNAAHLALAELERAGRLHAVITQNIDNLHQRAGSREVHEFHGSMAAMDCLQCRRKTPASEVSLNLLPPPCPICGGLLKPDIVFFGEPIPEGAYQFSTLAAQKCEAVLIVGTSGNVHPAARIPHMAKHAGARIIEVNVQPSSYTESITDVFLQGPAGATLAALRDALLG
ncbi:SIR2 family NAD-dependent protein deacylase [Paucidesulfovibrio longus]|uniref:SIR2 family NAD-dependent protein deacylase n=1 Tax=Paucidesulfovibrio longus TaxID=889 RepID=UPI0003B4FA2D|nr:NAD-dependent deacylase [Paucidesulfovibrio longus]